MSVWSSCLSELEAMDESGSADGELALSLASAIDDRAGVQGLAATAKEYRALMDALRVRHKPKELGRLDLIRGGKGTAAKSEQRRSAASRRSAPTDREHAPRRSRKAE